MIHAIVGIPIVITSMGDAMAIEKWMITSNHDCDADNCDDNDECPNEEIDWAISMMAEELSERFPNVSIKKFQWIGGYKKWSIESSYIGGSDLVNVTQ